MKEKKKPFRFRGMRLFPVVLAVYGILFFVNSEAAILSLGKSWAILMKILPIFAVVILFTALLNYLIQPKQIARHLGDESGARGWFWALAAGVISHGPMYAWYPLIEDLRRHGLRDGLIVTFFYSRAMKIPLLPLMIDYFGWIFTLALALYIIIGSLVQGWCLQLMERGRE